MWHEMIFQQLVEEHIRALIDARPKAEQGDPDFLFVFDECTQLNKNTLDDQNRPKTPENLIGISPIALQGMLKACENYNVWFTLMDTNSGIATAHLPTGPQAPSARLASGYMPLPPWPYLPFDVWRDSVSAPVTAGDAMTLQHLCQYGRPVSLTAFLRKDDANFCRRSTGRAYQRICYFAPLKKSSYAIGNSILTTRSMSSPFSPLGCCLSSVLKKRPK
jgi:hypothetical protein